MILQENPHTLKLPATVFRLILDSFQPYWYLELRDAKSLQAMWAKVPMILPEEFDLSVIAPVNSWRLSLIAGTGPWFVFSRLSPGGLPVSEALLFYYEGILMHEIEGATWGGFIAGNARLFLKDKEVLLPLSDLPEVGSAVQLFSPEVISISQVPIEFQKNWFKQVQQIAYKEYLIISGPVVDAAGRLTDILRVYKNNIEIQEIILSTGNTGVSLDNWTIGNDILFYIKDRYEFCYYYL